MSTLLCVPIMVRDAESALADAAAARDLGADLVEFRIDEVFSGEGDSEGERLALRLSSASPLPCIVTCRAAEEGGGYTGDDAARVSLYERLGTASGPGEHPPRYIDVELATYARSENLRRKINLAVDHPGQRRDVRTSLILSFHDFAQRPADLTRRVLAMRAHDAAKVLKVAYRARSLRDNLELFDLLLESDRPMIALAMGDFGLMSRALAPKFGAFLTFASLRAESATAPGQPTVSDLLGTYRFRSIGPSTRVYGVVGWPVAHSRSPLIHNAGFEALGHEGVYLPLPVASGEGGGYESFKATLGELVDHPALDFCGCSVTLPHKEHLVRLATERAWPLDEASRAVGAANTLVIDRDAGRVVGARVLNTDVVGLRAPLERHFGPGGLRGLPAAVLGAGGAARAAAYVLARAGARVEVFARDLDRAEAVAAAAGPFAAHAPRARVWGEVHTSDSRLFINCTPIGMTGGPAERSSPLDVGALPRADPAQILAFDTVYTPPLTPFLSEARAAGWRTIDGVEMFVAQAAGQFEAWTGKPAPSRLFETVLREALPRP